MIQELRVYIERNLKDRKNYGIGAILVGFESVSVRRIRGVRSIKKLRGRARAGKRGGREIQEENCVRRNTCSSGRRYQGIAADGSPPPPPPGIPRLCITIANKHPLAAPRALSFSL